MAGIFCDLRSKFFAISVPNFEQCDGIFVLSVSILAAIFEEKYGTVVLGWFFSRQISKTYLVFGDDKIFKSCEID